MRDEDKMNRNTVEVKRDEDMREREIK